MLDWLVLAVSQISFYSLEIDEVVRLHKLEVAICEDHFGQLCNVFAINLKSKWVLLNELRYSIKEQDEDRSDSLLDHGFWDLSCKEIAESIDCRLVCWLLGRRPCFIQRQTKSLELFEEIMPIVDPFF